MTDTYDEQIERLVVADRGTIYCEWLNGRGIFDVPEFCSGCLTQMRFDPEDNVSADAPPAVRALCERLIADETIPRYDRDIIPDREHLERFAHYQRAFRAAAQEVAPC